MPSRRFGHIAPASPSNPLPTIDSLVEALRYITAQSSAQITTLPPTATNADIINKVNEIINRLQGTG